MLWLILLCVYFMFSRSTVPVAGQSTVSSCATSGVESDESLKRCREEYGNILETAKQNIRSLSSDIDKIKVRLSDHVMEDHQSKGIPDHCRNTSDLCDCSDVKASGYTTSGVYPIYVVDEGQRYYAKAFCDMTTTNRSWTVFQRRKDGSVDFYRGWNNYELGFGNPSGEFWLGNSFLHVLTSKRRYRLRIDMEDFEGGKRYAEYSSFSISSSAEKYKLTVVEYSGNAGGDDLNGNNGHRFTTKDSDNDENSSGNCARDRRGAWWYRNCAFSNLNGLYLRGDYSSHRSNGSFNGKEGIYWSHWHYEWYSLKATEMKISSP